MVRRLDVLLERLHETEFRESYQTTNLFHSSLCPIGQIFASLWNSLSVCKYVCLEEGGGEIPGHQRFIRLIYKALGKGGPERWRAVETQEKPERGGERERERGKIWES